MKDCCALESMFNLRWSKYRSTLLIRSLQGRVMLMSCNIKVEFNLKFPLSEVILADHRDLLYKESVRSVFNKVIVIDKGLNSTLDY